METNKKYFKYEIVKKKNTGKRWYWVRRIIFSPTTMEEAAVKIFGKGYSYEFTDLKRFDTLAKARRHKTKLQDAYAQLEEMNLEVEEDSKNGAV